MEIICIDGPAGAGKSTLARELAKALGWIYLDTGAIYRALAVAASQRGVDPGDQRAAETLARQAAVRVVPGPAGTTILVDDRDVTPLLRTPEISLKASAISAWPGVRAALLDLQRTLGRAGRIVAEGRDMGTVVFPAAGLKFFLSASAQARAERRYQELAVQGQAPDRQEVTRDLLARDRADETRAAAPLTAAPDAMVIDSTTMSIREVLAFMLAEAARRHMTAGSLRP